MSSTMTKTFKLNKGWSTKGCSIRSVCSTGRSHVNRCPNRVSKTRVQAEQSDAGEILPDNVQNGSLGVEEEQEDYLTMYGLQETMKGPSLQLKFVWGKDTLAFAVDQLLGKGNTSPLTEYFFWPQDDAWENLKAVLEAKEWIPAQEKIGMLNKVTEVISFWTPEEGSEQNTQEQASSKYPECQFVGQFY